MFLIVPVTLQGMEERIRSRVAEAVQGRMDELRIAPPRMVELTGVDKNTVRDFLTGRRRLQAANQLRFDDALRWEPGSLRRMYSGGTPVPLPKPAAVADPLKLISDEELLAEVLNRMKGARRVVEVAEESPAPKAASENEKTGTSSDDSKGSALSRLAVHQEAAKAMRSDRRVDDTNDAHQQRR